MSDLEFKFVTRIFYFPWYYSVHETLLLNMYGTFGRAYCLRLPWATLNMETTSPCEKSVII